jgi:hypothetical protein
VVGPVLKPVKLAFGNRLRILLVLARLRCFGGLLGCLLFFPFIFILLYLLFSLRRGARSAVLGAWDGDALGFERLFDLGQLLDEGGELIDVERDALERIED